MSELVAGNQVLAAKRSAFSKHLRASSSGAFASLPVFDYVQRINHLQRAILTNQLFRLAPQRLYVFRTLFSSARHICPEKFNTFRGDDFCVRLNQS
jgi:hypothetical protein